MEQIYEQAKKIVELQKLYFKLCKEYYNREDNEQVKTK